MSHVYYRRPKPGERFIDYEREELGQRSDGIIVDTDDDTGDCKVKFKTFSVERRSDCCVRINGILHNENVLLWQPEYLNQVSGETKRYLYEDIEYISHKVGVGAWVSDE